MKIILIGFMCSGKTTVAPILGRKLNLEVIETDDEIRKMIGKTTDEIFRKNGEVGYREYEIAVAKQIRDKTNVIISTGGGVVMNKIILDYVRDNGSVVFLDTSFQTLLKRLDPKIPRPLFENKSQAEDLYNFRLPLYKRYADIIINTENKSLDKIADEVISKLPKQ